MILEKKNFYTEDEKWLSQCIFFRSTAGYKFLRDILNLHLPSISSLHKWIKIKSISPGLDSSVSNELMKHVSKLNDHEREVILLFDEMSIQENLTYNQFKDKIDGFVDYGSAGRENIIAKSVCVFMVRSLLGKFKQVLYYVSSPGSIPAKILDAEIKKCIDIVNNFGLNVRAIGCDQGPTNRKVYNEHKISHESPFFTYDNKKFYALYDACHLFKSIRNNLIKTNLMTPDGEVSWDIITIVYKTEECEVTKICPKLTYRHISPSDFDKMNVRLAVQVLSHSVAVGIRTLLVYEKYPKHLCEIALSTSKFISKMNKLFDILNGKPVLKRNCPEIEFLFQMKNYIIQIKPKTNYDMTHCFKGLALTIETVIALSHSLLSVHENINFFSVQKLNQDPLENFFSHIRSRNSNKRNPSLFEFGALFAKLMSIRLLFSSKFSNCDDDNDEIFDLDWSAVSEDIILLDDDVTHDSDLILEVAELEQGEFVQQQNSTEETMGDDQEMLNESTDETEDIVNSSTRYFSGYCYLKMIKHFRQICSKCSEQMTAKLEANNMSELLIKLKQYENSNKDCSLVNPSEKFYKICKNNIKIFIDIFENTPHNYKIKKTILNQCIEKTKIIYPDWFNENNECYTHHYYILDFLILVLLRKHCKWTIDIKNASKKKINKKIQKLVNLTNR